ncbi:hypothetical protein [Virgibacillus chiguensis]|uniref:Uncharacterized protein n=1 Tax=Virgibacillus chiguensis TaxID=411959 RepID=A0A1M5SL02_9BACI|nr:hypothetical protein [Virgibacillus chiguensis]SHH39214.1 hypothetical protein SAMN05421807_106221 [Virgibacillus chiguensis]
MMDVWVLMVYLYKIKKLYRIIWGVGRKNDGKKELVHAFAACNNWVSELTKGPEKDMFQAIAKGKW